MIRVHANPNVRRELVHPHHAVLISIRNTLMEKIQGKINDIDINTSTLTSKDNDPKEKVVIDCKVCNNQGEIKDNEKNRFNIRYLHQFA